MLILCYISRFKKVIFLTVMALLSKSVFAELPHSLCTTVCANYLEKGKECIKVNNKQIYIHSAGHGKPVVIFSSGTGLSADIWFESGTATKLAEKTTILAYDRLYTFNSCQNANDFMPVTAASVAHQLHQLLALLKLPPPYILVGHSMGGLYMLYYASYYPQEIAGILLLDATSPEGPTPLPEKALPFLKKLGNPQNPSPDNFLYNEIIGQLPSYIQMQHAPPLSKDVPLIVLSASRHCLPLTWTKKLICMTSQQEKNHQRQQKAMASLSNQSNYQLVPGDHNIFFTEKGSQVVIGALYQLLDKVQK